MILLAAFNSRRRRIFVRIKQPRPFRTRPAISWPGGKRRLLDIILPLIPEHTCYVEPFAGGLAVLLAKPRSKNEIINDTHSDLVNFYRCVRFHADVLLTELEFVLNSRQEFHDFRAQPGLTDIQRAARWFLRNKIGFGGSPESFGVRVQHPVSSRAGRMEVIRQLNLRLDAVTIEHLDWQRCVELYDRTSSFFFLDPPYVGGGTKNYSAWQDSDVIALRQRLDRLRGKWLLTLNDSPAIRGIFHDCRLKAVSRARGIDNRAGETTIYKELVIAPR
jgi:DNA adenine methylase